MTRALPISLQILISRCFIRVSTHKVIKNATTIKWYPILVTCHQNLLLFCGLVQFGHISAGNKTTKMITELSMATVYIFTVAMVTILMVFLLSSSSPPQSPYHSSSSSAPAKKRRQKVGDSLILS